jgi:acyl-CoA synthetase (AMP-forming)/AMP-acid ligase II
MGLRSFLSCVDHSRPRALLGIPLARIVSRVFRRAFRSVEVRVGASNSLTGRLTRPGVATTSLQGGVAENAPSDLAAVLFTSGSTGAPKGVCYEHGMFDAQVRIIRETYGIEPGEIDLPMLPIFALFGPALGMTTIVPEIDPRSPAAIDPEKIVHAIQQEGVTNSFGSPTLWGKIADHCVAQKVTLPSMRRVLCAGAPVPARLWHSVPSWMPQGQLHSPYGATEVLPVSSIASKEMIALAERAPAGTANGACVGRAVVGASIKIIAITDEPIAMLADARELPAGEIGEIVVTGPSVTKCYDDAPSATIAAKISDSQLSALSSQLGVPRIWHRMGDCGYLDADGRLWFCGRKVERVETADGPLFTEPCERVFRAHPRVGRCALIGLGARGRQRPALVVEAAPKGADACRAFAGELRELAQAQPHTAAITLFYFRETFPVDVRHNAKIHRLALACWAQTARRYEIAPRR